MLHPRYANRDIKVPNSSPYHVQLFFDNFDILEIYEPSGIKDRVAFFISKFGKLIGPNTIVVGVFNMELNQPKSHAGHTLLDYLLAKKLIYHDLEDTNYTFTRDQRGHQQYSFVDHLITPMNNSVNIISATTHPIAVSHHLILNFKISFTNLPLLPKNPKIKAYRLRDEDILIKYHNYLDCNLIKSNSDFHYTTSVPFESTNHEPSQQRLDKVNEAYDLLLNSIIDFHY